MTPSDTVIQHDRIQKAYDLAYEFEQKHGVCPQCVIAALQEAFGIVDDETFKASHVLAGGGGLTRKGTCGALIGAMMAVSATCGRDKANFANGLYLDAFKHAKEVLDRFVEEFGSPLCGEVQEKVLGRSYDFWDSDEFEAFEEAGGHRDKCPAVAGFAAKIAAEKLIELEEAA